MSQEKKDGRKIGTGAIPGAYDVPGTGLSALAMLTHFILVITL